MASRSTDQSDEDAEISRLLRAGIAQSSTYAESKLTKERTRVAEYIDGQLPKRIHAGDSGYNSYDVYEGVESMKAQILETFSSNSRPVTFNCGPNEDEADANLRTDYTNDVVFSQNDGFNIFRDVIGNGLKNRAGVVKVWWDSKVTTEDYELADTNAQELMAHLAANEEHTLTGVTLNEDGETIKRADLQVKKDRSQVRIVVLPGEEFGISPMATSIKDADLVYHRYHRTISQLIKEGYDRSTVLALNNDDDLWHNTETTERFHETGETIGNATRESGQLAGRKCNVYECYMEFDLAKKGSDDEGVSNLYKVVLVGEVVLHKERVDRKPFVPYIPLPRENAFWGHNYAKMLESTQQARTYLTRSVINHTLITNNPRMMVVKGAVDNPRELMENRFGGIVNVKNAEGVVPMPQASLNPFVFQTIQMLQANKEELTGISALSQGLDKDAISKQNSQDMVHELITVSQIRQKIVARNFAENFLRDLFGEVYMLVVENETQQRLVEVVGKWTPVDFTVWPQDSRVSVSFALGYGEEKKEMQKWLGLHSVLTQLPMLQGQYTPAQEYRVIKNAMMAGGIRDTENYLLPPGDPGIQPKPPDPLQQAEVAAKNADAAQKNAQAQTQQAAAGQAQAELQFNQQKMQLQLQGEQIKLEIEKLKLQAEQGKAALDQAKLQLETMKINGELQIKRDELAHKIIVDTSEIQLQKEAFEVQKLTAAAAPTRN